MPTNATQTTSHNGADTPLPSSLPLGWRAWSGIVLLTAVGCLWFPGNTFLRSDSLIYVPILERLQNPVLFEKDIMATRPFEFSIYDQVALELTSYTPLTLEAALRVEQIAFRGLAIAGIFLIAAAIGLPPLGAWFVAAIVSLGAPVTGSPFATMEAEPVPRAFALGCMLFGTGLALYGRPLWAGALGAVAFLYHPTTAIPFAVAMAWVVVRRKAPFTALAPLVAAPLLLLLVAHFGPPTAEAPSVFHRLDVSEEAFQRMITPYIFVSEWRPRMVAEVAFQIAAGALAWWMLRARLRGLSREWLGSLSLIAIASIPVSWMVLEGAGLPEFQPIRAVMLIPIISGLLATCCSFFAAERREWIRATAWLGLALMLPLEPPLITWFVTPIAAASACLLLVAMALGLWLGHRTRGISVVAAGLLPFVVFPMFILGPAVSAETPGLEQVAKWARGNTVEDAMFLFPDSGEGNQPAIFRALAQRPLYVDWKSCGQANYFPGFAGDWRTRWQFVNQSRWMVSASDLSTLRRLGVDYIVMRAVDAIPGLTPDFQNSEYFVYRVP